MPDLTAKQARFIDEYLKDLNATQAAIRSGYSKRNADKIGPELLGKTRVKEEIKKRQAALSKKAELSHEWVIEQLKTVYKRCMQDIPVLDHEGIPTGEYKFEYPGANKALELIGKHLGTFSDRLQLTGKDGEPIQHQVDIKAKLSIDEINDRIQSLLDKD